MNKVTNLDIACILLAALIIFAISLSSILKIEAEYVRAFIGALTTLLGFMFGKKTPSDM